MSLDPPKKAETEFEKKQANYQSDNYFPEDDFEPGLEGFLHNIKR